MGYPPVAFAAQDYIIAGLTAAGATEPGAGITRHLVEPQARRLIAGRTGFHPWKLA